MELNWEEYEEDIYTKEGMEELVEDDEMTSAEEGFMRGYRSAM